MGVGVVSVAVVWSLNTQLSDNNFTSTTCEGRAFPDRCQLNVETFFSNSIGSTRADPYWTSRENSLDLKI
jgi:hypothetical protein